MISSDSQPVPSPQEIEAGSLLEKHEDKVVTSLLSLLPKDPADWQLIGIVNKDKDVFTFGNDSKIVGRAFEVIATAYVKQLADSLGFKFHESEIQTVYPDFVLEKPNGRLIAIDVKSTYRNFASNGNTKAFNFTLGSFTSYLRNGTKNIYGSYDDYEAHYVFAFLYSRTNRFETTKVSIDDIDSIKPAYEDVEIAFMEKYRLAGDKPGSGNTDNIGTFKSTAMEPFQYGAGPFALLGNDVFEHYWRNYPRNADTANEKASRFRNLPGYFDWLERQDDSPFDADTLRETYADYKKFVTAKGWKISLS
ncbi:type II restriction endonuclease [Corynebacterium senegalense]|uniref:type II restriction endonuclease n=1 Tax=Corynebacterium senegalense TaxID=2080750 RepID=UPI001C696010|nr:type II restriction endonuclease [Corynebacterium senegalense]